MKQQGLDEHNWNH